MVLDKIKMLRSMCGAGVMDCKEALKEADGDMDKAIEILRKRGIAKAAKKVSREAKEGVIESYIHHGSKIGVLIEVNCETDFVARNKDFKTFVRDLTMQVAASNPLYLKKEDVPKELRDKEAEIIREQNKGKPENVLDKIVAGRLDKFYQDICLLEQPFVKDPNISIRDYLTSTIAKIGENIVVRRFVRFQLGEEV